MKTITIDTAAAWVTTIRAIQDGEALSEANISDIMADDVADRLGYLKTAVDAKPDLADANTWTNGNEFFTDYGNLVVSGSGELECQTSATFAASVAFNGETTVYDTLAVAGAFVLDDQTLADANSTIAATGFHKRVPTLTANRTYTLPAAAALVDGHTIRITRMRTADAYSVTVQDPTGPTTLGVISASAAGWIEVIKRSGNVWRVSAWGGTVTSLDTGV